MTHTRRYRAIRATVRALTLAALATGIVAAAWLIIITAYALTHPA